MSLNKHTIQQDFAKYRLRDTKTVVTIIIIILIHSNNSKIPKLVYCKTNLKHFSINFQSSASCYAFKENSNYLCHRVCIIPLRSHGSDQTQDQSQGWRQNLRSSCYLSEMPDVHFLSSHLKW